MARNQIYVGIDWDKDGNYTDETSSVLTSAITIRRGRQQMLSSSGYESIQPADVWGKFRNADRRFDHFNASSPIYDYLYPGRPMVIRVTRGATTYDLFTGWLTDLRSMGAKEKDAVFRASDGLAFLDMQHGYSASPQNISVAQALQNLIDASDWPVTAGANIEDNEDSITGFQPDVKQTLLEDIREIATAFGGTAFINASGGFEYRTRASTAPTVATITEQDVGREFEIRSPWDEIYNDVRVDSRAYDATAEGAASQSNYGRRTMTIGGGVNDYIQSTTAAQNLANWVLDYAEIAKKVLRVRFTNSFDLQFGLDLMDRVHVNMPARGIDALYNVGYIEHNFMSAGNCVTTMHLEPYRWELLEQMYPLTFDFTLGW